MNEQQIEQQVHKIESIVPVVAAAHEAFAAACAEERAAEVALLGRVVDLVRPALRGLSSRILVSERTSWHGGNTYTDTERAYAEGIRGVLVTDGQAGPSQINSRDNDGAYGGEDLYLTTEGDFVEVIWSGSWSRWQGAGSSAEAEVRRMSPSEVVAEYDVGAILGMLARRLDAAACGDKPKRTEAARTRAAQLGAVATLIQGGR